MDLLKIKLINFFSINERIFWAYSPFWSIFYSLYSVFSTLFLLVSSNDRTAEYRRLLSLCAVGFGRRFAAVLCSLQFFIFFYIYLIINVLFILPQYFSLFFVSISSKLNYQLLLDIVLLRIVNKNLLFDKIVHGLFSLHQI